MRNLLLFVLILVGIWWLRRVLGPKSRGGGAGASRGGQGKAPAGEGAMERMVECAHCGVHVPESEGVSDAGRFYCSEAHRRLGPGRGR
ncbi:hypothetical protein CJ010_20510 [Azoarcus sp. DD4]|uniref:PP0621 family protein n=1 Tax=Azoarcus sp. DD4 TaxID=2027405 RepID=UPI00112B560C|nr:PP0621 family protein [Azoarcus sp. DD4]QDF98745.1 hypothetical protein CJ010_20510 [Azoarcus sp. DD4]